MALNRITVECLWRPPKDHWPTLGARWRSVTVIMESADRSEGAACDACLFLIATRRGQAKAVTCTIGPNGNLELLSHIAFNWSDYDGTVTWGGHVADVV